MADSKNERVVSVLSSLYNVEQIFHLAAPLNCSYPMVVYNRLTGSPSLRADNRTKGGRDVFRITVIDTKETPDGAIREAFEADGWLWEGTNVVQDKAKNESDEVYTAIDVSILYSI